MDEQKQPDKPVVGRIVPAPGTERPAENKVQVLPKGTPVDLRKDKAGPMVPMPGPNYATKADLDAAMKPIRECYELISADFLRLVQAIRTMNHYQQRIPEVTEVCAAILQPDPALAKANEALAEARACKRRVGKPTSVTADWDANWQYLFTWRGENGFSTIPGFDLREGHAGLDALKEALVAHGIPLKECHLDPPSDNDGKGMARRVIWQAAVK